MGRKRKQSNGNGSYGSDPKSADALAVEDKCRRRFDAYYAAQLGLDDAEWARATRAFEKPLPATFRVTAAGPLAARIETELVACAARCDARASTLKAAGVADEDLARFSRDADPAAAAARWHALASSPLNLRPIAWVPGRRAWRLDAERAALRKSPAHKELHAYLVAHESAGTVTRQEAVSMVPPLFLRAQPGDRVLDTCAAPGSKTSQLLEAVDPPGASARTRLLGAGLVVANDENLSRCHTLVHQTKRFGSSAWAATHGDATLFPSLRGAERGSPRVPFDRVLCDVPCSSDGTLRKTPSIKKRWSCRQGLALHALQARIAIRGAQVLKPGGVLVYSTCSLNPIEDEAVVAEVLRRDPSLEVVLDAAAGPGLTRRPGLATWRVFEDGGGDELLVERSRAEPGRAKASAFPPADDEGRISAQLPRCMRFLPHDDDTGGFFVAVLRKAPAAAPAPPAPVVAPPPAPRPASSSKPKKSEDINFVRFRDVADVASLEAFYGLQGFPWELLVCRSGDDNEMATNAAGKKVILANAATAELCVRASDLKLRVVHAGVIAFTRTSDSAKGAVDYRLSQDGVGLVLPFLTKRRVACGRADFEALLDGGARAPDKFAPAVAARFAGWPVGSVVFVLEGAGDEAPPALVTWLGAAGFVTVFCAKDDLVVLKSRVKAVLGDAVAEA